MHYGELHSSPSLGALVAAHLRELIEARAVACEEIRRRIVRHRQEGLQRRSLAAVIVVTVISRQHLRRIIDAGIKVTAHRARDDRPEVREAVLLVGHRAALRVRRRRRGLPSRKYAAEQRRIRAREATHRPCQSDQHRHQTFAQRYWNETQQLAIYVAEKYILIT